MRMHKTLGLGGMIFFQEGTDLKCESWSYFLPTVMIYSICIQFGLKIIVKECILDPQILAEHLAFIF